MPKAKRQLTPYGRWMKITLMDKNMTASDLAEKAGMRKQRVSDVMYGVFPGIKYRPKIEKALGAKPPANIDNTAV